MREQFYWVRCHRFKQPVFSGSEMNRIASNLTSFSRRSISNPSKPMSPFYSASWMGSKDLAIRAMFWRCDRTTTARARRAGQRIELRKSIACMPS